MADTYKSFKELESREREGDDWAREFIDRGSSVVVMAPHGGWIEPFTAELAHAVAGDELSLYAFHGLKSEGNQALHLTSHRFDEPMALNAAAATPRVFAIHGERSHDQSFVMVGGLWEACRARLAAALEEAGFLVRRPRKGLGGEHPMNICNRGTAGAGAQIEISEGLRTEMKGDSAAFRRFVGVLREILFEMGGVDGHGGLS